MRDVLEEAKRIYNDTMRPGSGDSDINPFNEEQKISRGILYGLIKEIETLRAPEPAKPTTPKGQEMNPSEPDIREILTWYFNRFPTDDPYGQEVIINQCVDHYSTKNFRDIKQEIKQNG